MDPSQHWAQFQRYSRLTAGNHQINQLNVASGLNIGQSGHQLNVNDHFGVSAVTANAATNQAMTGHYGSSAAHPHWFFPHGLNAASHQMPSHDSSSFNANPFYHPSSHPYDSGFLPSFPTKTSYLQSAGVGTNLRNAAAYSSMTGMSGISAANNINNMSAETNPSLGAGSLFHANLTAPNNVWRHHSSLISNDSTSRAFGILPHEDINRGNVMNAAANTISSHSHPSHSSHGSHSSHSHNSSHHSSHKSSNESLKSHSSHSSHYHSSHPKTSSSVSSVENSFRNIMPSLPPNQSSHAIASRGQPSLDATVGAKITGHHHNQADPYAFMAAHAIGTDYPSMQTQRYASSLATGNQQAMTAFSSNTSSRSAYPSVGFPSEANARNTALMNSSLLQSSKQGSNNSCNARTMSAINPMNGAYLPTCAMMPMMNTSAQSVGNYSSSPAHSVNVLSNNLTANQSVSRSSSSASNHGLQQGNDSSCSFGYNSPATNLPQSPYPQPQRSNTSNSSQSTPTATGATVQSSTQDFSSYGSQAFPSMGAQTPTPTPGGYPTPPSSVGQPHVMTSNSQTSSIHEEQVQHYPQLTPQTPTQSTPFAANYATNFGSNSKLPTNGSQTTESILTNTSSCMVAAAAAANMNSAQNNSSVAHQRPGFLISGASIHEPEPESCGMSSMVAVNHINDNISNNKLNSEPTLNSVFSSQEIDFPIINFSAEETNNGFNSNLKVEQNFNNKKKSKNSKKNKKKDKNKNNVSVGLSVEANNPYSYDYPNITHPTQQQLSDYQNYQNHQNSYQCQSLSMQQKMAHHNQTPQEPQQNHNVMPTDSSGTDTHTNANSCYEMQFQQHLTQQQTQQQQHPTPGEHDLMQSLPSHESLPTVQTQEQQLIEPVISMASQQMTQTTNNTIAEKQTFPTIDDELSFLTEPTDCVSMETQTPNISSGVQMETQSPLVINQSSNICSDRSNANLSPNANHNSNSNQGNSNSSQPSGYLKNYISFISNSPNATNAPNLFKEKKKKKLKESNENKVKQNNNTINGQKTSKAKKIKPDNTYDCLNEDVFDSKKNNFSVVSHNAPKLMSGENVSLKKSSTGDRENYESKFFKRRPSTNINTNTVHIIEMDSRKDIKINKKRKQNKMDLFSNESQTTHDEYEFPDSPPNTHSVKKSRKSSSSDTSNKKRTAPDFEKITSPSININFKKNNNKKNNVLTNSSKPILSTSSTESIENSINSVVMNTTLMDIIEDIKEEEKPVLPVDQSIQNPIQTNQNLTEIPKPNVNSVPNPTNNKIPNNISNQTNKKSSNLKTSPTVITTPITVATTMTSTVAIEHILSPIQTPPICTTTINNTLTTTTTPTTNSLNTLTVQTNNNCSLQSSVGMQSAGTNTPRRRSQDKKASTIREGLMRTGDFVVSMDESQYDLPVIWRIEGKSLLQRFEPTEQDDITVYINTSSYSAWNPTVRQRYTGVDVRIMGCSRTRIVVEKLGLTQNNPNALNGLATIERIGNKGNASQSSNTYHNQENFEVFIQTLISQALDPNFISEIVKENDEYFLSHVQAIDDVCSRKKSRFFSKVKWDANIVKCVETYPLFTVTAQNNVGDLRCRLCHDNWSTQIMQFNGQPYNQMTLEPQTGVDLKQTKYAACDPCADKIVLYSHLHHQKYNFFSKCKTKVENMRGGDESKESHVILELCLQDSEWINTLFKELEEIWLSCDKIR